MNVFLEVLTTITKFYALTVCFVFHAHMFSLFALQEFLAYMLIVLKKVNKADIDEISQLFHKLDVTCNNSLTKQDVAFRMEKLQELFTVPTTTNIS